MDPVSQNPKTSASDVTTAGAPAAGGESLLADVLRKRIEEMGELPFARRKGPQIVRVSENLRTGPADVARLILKDREFAEKVLEVSNAPVFNTTEEGFKTVPEAAVMLGIDVIQQITLGLAFVEILDEGLRVNVTRIIASALASGVIGHHLATYDAYPKPSEAFVAPLIQNLGPLAVAYYMPAAYLEIERKRAENPQVEIRKIEEDVAGWSSSEIGRALAAEWKIPRLLLRATRGVLKDVSSPAGHPNEKLRIIAISATRLCRNLFDDSGLCEEFSENLDRLRFGMGFSLRETLHVIERAFEETCRMGIQFGLKAEDFLPTPGADKYNPSSTRRQVVARVSRTVHGLARRQRQDELRRTRVPEPVETQEHPKDGDLERDESAPRQLECLRKISQHIFESPDLNSLLHLTMEGLHEGVGFERVLLIMCNPDRTRFVGKQVLGEGFESIESEIDFPNDARDNIFAKAYRARKPIFMRRIESVGIGKLVPEVLSREHRVCSFVIGPIIVSGTVIGFIYGDKNPSHSTIQPSEYEAFVHFLQQTEIGLDRMTLISGRVH